MRHISFGSVSCGFFVCAVLALAWMGVCRVGIEITPPGGSGEFQGMNHLGWRMGIFFMSGMIPFVSLVGFLLGAIGAFRARGDRSLCVMGTTLSRLALIASPFVFLWAQSIL